MKTIYVGLIITVVAASASVYKPPVDVSLYPPFESALAPFYKGDIDHALMVDEGRPHDFDVKRYVIDIEIDDNDETVDGTTTIETVITADGTEEMVFDLGYEFYVGAVRVNGSSASFNHSSGLLTVELAPALDDGTPADVEVDYAGPPAYGMYFAPEAIFTSVEPSDSDHWYPCYDHPSDKAEDGCELFITVDSDFIVASVGLLENVTTPIPGKRTYHWVGTYPIATYLISVAISDYATFSDSWEQMPIDYFVYPSLLDDAMDAYANTPLMLTCFKELYGEYPFKDEKYGMAMAPMGGAMEHQTCTTIDDYWSHPAPEDDWIIAHELAHQWWGDWVTCGTWADIWLNEGFATYSDALFHEYSQGWDAFYNRMQSFKQQYFDEDEEYRFPIYDPDYMWSATVYEKGAWILHMLRHLLGDDDFFGGLRYYGGQHEYDTAVTAELIDDMEAYTGEDLDWFFDEWVYLAGYPEFEYSWTVDRRERSQVFVVIRQIQDLDPLTPVFRTYVDLTADTPSGEETITVWVQDDNEQYNLEFSDTVNELYFDKYGWLLCTVVDSTPVTLDYFEAESVTGGIELSWAVRDSYDVAGFNLYRARAEKKTEPVKINAELITGESPYVYEDKGLISGETYSYMLEAVDFSGATETFGPTTAEAGPALPTEFALAQNAPNPARGVTNFRFALPKPTKAELAVYDMAGRKIATVFDERLEAGEYNVPYEVSLAPGVYVYRLTTETDAAARKFVVVR
ncbi:MAG: T9SS type A sorting domain-containing protein [Candidatus Coatesbacteria bacterium]|nr:MAG: T9SS type A sorting domain-containing protein [Candidatus Coatesbacteria bacterium]